MVTSTKAAAIESASPPPWTMCSNGCGIFAKAYVVGGNGKKRPVCQTCKQKKGHALMRSSEKSARWHEAVRYREMLELGGKR